MRFPRGILFLIGFFLLSVLPVSAHGYLIRSIPEDRSQLERPPARLQYWFSESLEAQFSGILLRDDRGNILAEGAVDAQDERLLSLQVPQDLPDGAYIVELRPAFAGDGHVVIETRVFFVGDADTSIISQASKDEAEGFEIFWKALLFNASSLLFGLTMLYAYLLVPVWGNEVYPQGLLPPRLMHRLNLLMFFGLFLAAYANVMGLLQQASVFFNTSLDVVLEGGLWEVVRIGSRFGDVWNFRMLVLLLVLLMHCASLYFGKQFPKAVRSFWTANVYLLALLLGAQAVNSHAAGSLILPWLAMLNHWLHVLSVAFWVGSIISLALILPTALQPYEGATRWQALEPLMRRFSRYMRGILLLVISTGIYSAANWFYTPSDLLSSYGMALGYKLAMMSLLLFVGALHHLALRPQVLEIEALARLRNWAQGFGISMRIETILAIVTLIMAAFLSATPIPEPEFLRPTIETPSQNQRIGDYDVQMSLAPAAPAINSLDLVLRRDILLVEDARVYVQFVLPAKDKRSAWLEADKLDSGLYALVSERIDETGSWLVLLDIIDAEGQISRLVFAWEIRAEASLLRSVSPSLLSIGAALFVLAALSYVAYPSGRKLATKMDWSMTNIVVASGVIIMTIVSLALSTVFLNYQREQAALAQTPLPEIINSVVPDSGSVAIGASLLREACGWEGIRDYAELLGRIDTLRDEDLFRMSERGWRGLPACDLTITERWHLVNYLRSLEER
jgi:copper transport protein